MRSKRAFGPIAGIALALAVSAAAVPARADETATGLESGSPAAELAPGEHGSVISVRPITGDPGVPGARNYLVRYRSVDLSGRTVAVSGTVAVPRGPAPEGGWPLISWAHGTTGVADVCAPSRDTGPDYPAHDYTEQVRAVQARWIAAGYAVAQSDYQGLGTGGPHGYLIGEAEQRAVADMALAAREVDDAIGTRWVVMGHSQGGQAAVFADARAQQWAPRLQLLGAVAMAPASHLGLAIRALTLATDVGSARVAGSVAPGSAAFVPLFVRGAQTVAPIDPAKFLTPEALSLLPQADDRCIGQLREPDSWGGLHPGEVFTTPADTADLTRVLDDNDPSPLAFTRPLLVVQGRADTTVFPLTTDAMVAHQQLTGQPVAYRTYPGVDHRGVLAASYDDVSGWVDRLFGR